MNSSIKCLLILKLIFLVSIPAQAQFTVSYHLSNYSFIGFNYEFENGIIPEARIGSTGELNDISLEGVLLYGIIRKSDYCFYGGIGGGGSTIHTGVIIPVGLNIYPLSNKNFGLHMELAPIIWEDTFIRTSVGIRYRFKERSE